MYEGHVCFFFFQAEDGIRDYKVTGSDVCSSDLMELALLPQLAVALEAVGIERVDVAIAEVPHEQAPADGPEIGRREREPPRRVESPARSEERRVGEEGRSRWWPDHLKKKKKMQE